jgi:hypothetical protein
MIGIHKEPVDVEYDRLRYYDPRKYYIEKFEQIIDGIPELKSQVNNKKDLENVLKSCINLCRPIYERLNPMKNCVEHCTFNLDEFIEADLELIKADLKLLETKMYFNV